MSGHKTRVHAVMCMQVYLGCFVTTCDEPVLANFGLKTLKKIILSTKMLPSSNVYEWYEAKTEVMIK